MKILKNTKTNKVQSWNSNSVDVSSKDCEVFVKQFSKEDEEKLMTGEYKIDDNFLVIKKTNQGDEIKKQLKEKFQSGNFTNEDIRKLAEILL